MLDFIKKNLSSVQKRKIKAKINSLKKKYVAIFKSYSIGEFQKKLKDMGVKNGDSIMVHSGWSPLNGCKGTTQDIIQVLKNIVGKEGNLLMVSMPYGGATSEYLDNLKSFDVKRTISRMGMMSEIFRRQEGVLRSLNPAHPILAWGNDAEWFVDGHEKCLYSCGEGSPFDKMVTKGAKVIFFDVEFTTFTFFHYIEHVLRKKLPFPLYEEKVFSANVIDYKGNSLNVKTKAFSKEAVKSRRPLMLKKELKEKKMINWQKIGNTAIGVVDVNNALKCAEAMIGEDRFFHEI